MVNEIIKYLNGIGEVNLSAQKIELGVIEDMKKSSEQTKKLQ